MRLILIIFLSLFLYSCDSLNYLNHNANSIRNETYLKLIVSTYQENSLSSIEGYFVDVMLNFHVYEEQLNELSGAEVVFFYQSHEFLKIFLEENNLKALDLSLDMIDRAIKADPQNAFNYFFKSFLLFNKGEKDEADAIFLEGLGKPELRTYQEEGSYYFALFLKKAGLFQPNNAFMLLPAIAKLYIHAELHLYIANNLLSYIGNKDIERNTKRRIGNIFCSLASENKKIFSFIEVPQRKYFLYVIKKHEKEDLFPCSQDVNSMLSKPDKSFENLKAIVDNIIKDKELNKKDLKILENSELWKTMEEILK